jgi:hypothetical protein
LCTLLDLLEVIELIGRNPQDSFIHKRVMNGIEKIVGDDSAPMMPAFGPWVRKQQVECFDGSFRQQIANGIRALDTKNAHIFERGRFAADLSHAANQLFGTEKVLVRILAGQFTQEGAIATAKIDMQRRGTSKNGEEIERGEIALRD